MPVQDPYVGKTIAIATMHAKEHAVGKPFRRWLGADVIVAAGIDTDAIGTLYRRGARHYA